MGPNDKTPDGPRATIDAALKKSHKVVPKVAGPRDRFAGGAGGRNLSDCAGVDQRNALISASAR